MSIDDFETLDEIIKDNMNDQIYLNDTFNGYLKWAIGDALNLFVLEYKTDIIDIEEVGWEDKQNKLLKLYWDLIPFLQKRYYEEFKKSYSDWWRYKKPYGS